MHSRHALFYTPQPGPLAERLADWLGWDPATGKHRPHPALPGLPAPVAELTRRPRKYGAHGTLKPPFHLAPGTDVSALDTATWAFAARTAPVVLGGLKITRIGSFLALTPRGETTAQADLSDLSDLAAAVVRDFDPFRAPPTPQELERRRKARLSPRQEAHLARWGYPHVMEDFRFHITLTGPLKRDTLPAVQSALEAWLAPHLPVPFVLDALSLLTSDPDTGHFHLRHRVALSGGR